MSESQSKRARFVREFFFYLELHGITAAILHGGEDGFERDLSDVDFVVDKSSFCQLPSFIHDYCKQSGWQLCQIFLHETTAAYFVCSAIDDPTCAVALDACSDYQRNGTLFLKASLLLEQRTILFWGGYGLAPSVELRYRFAKAAAKGKDAVDAAKEFLRYPDEIRHDCELWLKQNWDITIKSWDTSSIAVALTQLRSQSNVRPSLFQRGALARILRRIIHPSGLIVVTGHEHFELLSTRIKEIYGHLYFRRFKKTKRWSSVMIKDLVASTIIVVPELPFPWFNLIPEFCIHCLTASHDMKLIANKLHERCLITVVL